MQPGKSRPARVSEWSRRSCKVDLHSWYSESDALRNKECPYALQSPNCNLSKIFIPPPPAHLYVSGECNAQWAMCEVISS